MAHLWTIHDNGEPIATRLDDAHAASLGVALNGARIRRVTETPESWVLLCAVDAGIRVNGESVPLGLVVLSDRDELRIPGEPTRFFSTEALAQVELFPDSSRGGCCPRCKQTIECGTRAVRCPSCGLWHHASDELPCWTYAATCAACPQDTAPDSGFRWTPEEL